MAVAGLPERISGVVEEEFGGRVKHWGPSGGTDWEDVWVGPGGRLVVRRVARDSVAGRLGVDAREVLVRSDGSAVWNVLSEGEEYGLLAELFGPVLWGRRHPVSVGE